MRAAYSTGISNSVLFLFSCRPVVLKLRLAFFCRLCSHVLLKDPSTEQKLVCLYARYCRLPTDAPSLPLYHQMPSPLRAHKNRQSKIRHELYAVQHFLAAYIAFRILINTHTDTPAAAKAGNIKSGRDREQARHQRWGTKAKATEQAKTKARQPNIRWQSTQTRRAITINSSSSGTNYRQ